MKKLLSLVLLFLIGCSSPDPINIDEMLIERDGVYYTKDTNQLYTGPVFSLYDEYGELKSEGTLKDGKKDGQVKYYQTNGQLWKEETYKNGEYISFKEFSFYENGQLGTEFSYKNGELDGPYKSYYENGQLRDEGNFKDGEFDGLWKVYNEDGKLILERIYEDGDILSSKEYD